LALEARQDCNQVHITVEDTGIGIGLDDLARIFDEYHQASPNSGLGLGLALTKRLVEGMGR
jgi:signal transduction histidine kinase